MKNNITIYIWYNREDITEYNVFHYFLKNERLFYVFIDLDNEFVIQYIDLNDIWLFEVSYELQNKIC